MDYENFHKTPFSLTHDLRFLFVRNATQLHRLVNEDRFELRFATLPDKENQSRVLATVTVQVVTFGNSSGCDLGDVEHHHHQYLCSEFSLREECETLCGREGTKCTWVDGSK